MNQVLTPVDVLRKVIFLAVLGFAVMVVSGPILAILSLFLSFAMVVLSFAFVGFLVWLPCHILLVGREAAFANLRVIAQTYGQAIGRLGQTIGRVLTFLPRSSLAIGNGLLALLGFVWRVFRGGVRFLGETAVIAFSGVLVGVVFGVLNARDHNPEAVIAMWAGLGGAMAALVGVTMTLLERRAIVRRPTGRISYQHREQMA